MTMKEVATAAYRFDRQLPGDMETELEATVRFRPNSFPTWSNATHLCVVEIDRETCVPRVLRYIAAEDCGRIINPRIADGQVYGGVIQGMGGVLLEDFVYDSDGNPLTSTLVDYLMPSTTEVPRIEIGHIETPSTTNPGGYKGIGEGGAIGSHAAVANAVADALAHLGIHATKTPLGPNDIHRLLVSAGQA
jgi:carbon-monoxide dehydrogenase large subunit